MKDWNEVKAELRKQDEANAITFDALNVEFELIDELIEARKEMKITQKELARKIGTTPKAISIFESKAGVPKLDTFIKVASSLGFGIELKEIR